MQNYNVVYQRVDLDRRDDLNYLFGLTRDLDNYGLLFLHVSRDNNGNFLFHFSFPQLDDDNYVYFDNNNNTLFVWGESNNYLQGVVLNRDEDELELTFYFGYDVLVSLSFPN